MRTRTNILKLLAILLLALPTGGCATGWHPFGTPITAAEKKEKKIVAATEPVMDGVQKDIHQTGMAIDAAIAGNPRALTVAKDFNMEARGLIDQVRGAPLTGEVLGWSTVVNGLISENANERAKAEKQRDADRKTINGQATELDELTREKAELDRKVAAYAKENEGLADLVHKGRTILIVIILFWVLAQVIKFAAPFVPALQGAAKIITSVVAPAASFALHKSETALSGLVTGIGSAIGEIRVAMPEKAKEIRQVFDSNLDTQHQAVVGTVANQTVGEATP